MEPLNLFGAKGPQGVRWTRCCPKFGGEPGPRQCRTLRVVSSGWMMRQEVVLAEI